MRRAWLVVTVLTLGWSAEAASSEGLDVGEWLGRPGVRLLAVEFYATWCEPCMKAVPKWKLLHKEYKDRGLRLIVVSVRDPDAASCDMPGWTPDASVCDLDGTLAKSWGVELKDGSMSLPAAFLWSWRGNLLVRKGHIAEVESAIKSELRELPRVFVDPDMDGTARQLVRSELSRTDKVVVVADEKEKKKLGELRDGSHGIQYDEELACDVTAQLPANSLLKGSFVGTRDGKRFMLSLLSAESFCLVKSAGVHWNDMKPEVSAAEAVAELLNSLRWPLELPKIGSAAVPFHPGGGIVGREGRIGETPEDWEPSATRSVLVEFGSEPLGAAVLLDGELLCNTTPCSEAVRVGRHTITMQAKRHSKKAETLDIDSKQSLVWKLSPEFGWVSVVSQPSGMPVKIDGKLVGTSPAPRLELDAGMHDVLVSSPCHYDAGERVRVELGKERSVSVEMKMKTGAIDVVARDHYRRAVEAEVYVDGEKMGSAPGVFKVSICAREAEVRHEGAVFKKALAVKEKEIVKIEAVLERKGSIDWVELAGGTFDMGSTKGDGDEGPVHEVSVSAFEIARTEVTNAQYFECVHLSRCSEPHWDDGSCYVLNGGRWETGVFPEAFRESNQPVVCVDWQQAREFSEWAGGRLCTEAEWEYVAPG